VPVTWSHLSFFVFDLGLALVLEVVLAIKRGRNIALLPFTVTG
jgi:hypothetical protein